MKFRIQVKTTDGRVWWEEYEENIVDPQLWAEDTIARFNNTLRPNEKARELLSVEIIGDENNKELHDWDKDIKGMSVPFRGKIVDMMVCRKCGITGKRFGFESTVKIDAKYRKKCFQRCDTARKELEKAK